MAKEAAVLVSKTEYESLLAIRGRQDEIIARNAELEKQVQWLMERMRLTRQKRFGSSSEKSEYDQLDFFNEAEATADEEPVESETTKVREHSRKKPPQSREIMPQGLPEEIIEHTLPENGRACPACGGDLYVMGKEERRELKLIPAKAVSVRHIRYVYSCRCCEREGCDVPVLKAEMGEPVLKGSIASPEAVAHIMAQKYVMGVPLYRQEQEYTRLGLGLTRQTMSNWVVKSAEQWLAPVYEALKARLVSGQVLHADETQLQVLHEEGKAAQSKSYMWMYRTSGDASRAIVLYEYQPDRKKKRPEEFLKGFKGYLHADGYSGYHDLPVEIKVVGCWAHARRKFDEALKGLKPQDQEGSKALVGKRYCDRLFEIEREIRELSPEEKFKHRQERAMPLLDEFKQWMHISAVAPKSLTGNAVGYVLGQWPYLRRYLEDGRLEISNNRAERSIKPFVIDRKNFLFANTARGARASAVTFSLIETAKENNLNPCEYLANIFRRAPNLDLTDPEQINTLLP